MRTVLFVTAIRSEYDILFSVMRAVDEYPDLDLKLIVTGAHLSPMYGYTVLEIEKDGFPIVERIESLLNSDSRAGRIKSAAIQLLSLVDIFAKVSPTFVVAPMDREEAITVALAGAYLNIPVVHIGGGDTTENGHIDNSVRHAVTKLSHIHMVATLRSKERVIALGEENWRVHVVGSPGLDRILSTPLVPRDVLWKKMGFDPGNQPYLVVIQHPTFPDNDRADEQIKNTLKAVADTHLPAFISYPNSDAGSQKIMAVIDEFQRKYPELIHKYQNISRLEFVNLLRNAHALVGNSSCGIIEAPLLKLPVVNVGERQIGREHAENVLYVDYDSDQIKSAIQRSVFDSEFRQLVNHISSPYGDGHAGERIAKLLAEVPLDERLTKKILL